MSLLSGHRDLSDSLRKADAMTAELLSDVINKACSRFPLLDRTDKAARIGQLIESAAWADAALALIELELPQWQLRRIIYDEGEWHCALSRQRELPDWLDQSIEAHHADLSLALLSAFLEVQRASAPSTRPSVPTVPRVADSLDAPLCCDNFM
jgi:hypothetical protein